MTLPKSRRGSERPHHNGGATHPPRAGDDSVRLERLVGVVREGVATILTEVPSQPTSIDLQVADVRLEIRWPDSSARSGVVPAEPVATLAVGQPGTAPPTPSADRARPTSPPDPVPGSADVSHVCAPTVGVFYRAPEPGAAPFVSPGDLVAPGQQVGIVETMKLMVPVEAEHRGRVVEILVADGGPVEYGDRLVAVAAE